ncbi:hypothetical protein CSUI_007495, partial [Cystoisospora suis]
FVASPSQCSFLCSPVQSSPFGAAHGRNGVNSPRIASPPLPFYLKHLATRGWTLKARRPRTWVKGPSQPMNLAVPSYIAGVTA